MAVAMPVFRRKQSARLAAQLNSPPLTWMAHSVALRNGMMPGSRRWTRAPTDTKSRAASGRMSSPYFIRVSPVDETSRGGRERAFPGAFLEGVLRTRESGPRDSAGHGSDRPALRAGRAAIEHLPRAGDDERVGVLLPGLDVDARRVEVAEVDALAALARDPGGERDADAGRLDARSRGRSSPGPSRGSSGPGCRRGRPGSGPTASGSSPCSGSRPRSISFPWTWLTSVTCGA